MTDFTGFYLEFPNESHEKEYLSMIDEWESAGGRLYPGALRNRGNSFKTWLSWVKDDEDITKIGDGRAPQTLYFLKKEGGERIYGAVSVRHFLTEGLLIGGGSIGYGIRPTERRKGYASMMLALALEKCPKYGYDRVLITCDKDNIGSARTAMKNGGVLQDEIAEENGNILQRYWIDL